MHAQYIRIHFIVVTNCDGSRIIWVRMGASETVGPMKITFGANLVRPH